MLVGDEGALHPEVEQDDAQHQPAQRRPGPEDGPGDEGEQGAEPDHQLRPAPVGQASGQRRRGDAHRPDHAEQPRHLGAEQEGRLLQPQRQHRPEGGE